MTCLFFGCWNTAGHYLVGPSGWSVYKEFGDRPVYFGPPHDRRHLDGSLAPRVTTNRYARRGMGELGAIVFNAQGLTADGRRDIDYSSSECPQGQFLLHVLDNGFTAIQWWDRCQGDGRGACNSTVLLEGVHDAATMVKAAQEHFPHVLENLKKAGVELVEVTPSPLAPAAPRR